ncbi:MAG: Formation of crista junctions protein 1 [Candelina mexicana]|nr:MAG: Formation of crista junctions protein 1 [Candelina mexicana]
MLRFSPSFSRTLNANSVAGRSGAQWLTVNQRSAWVVGRRYIANAKKPDPNTKESIYDSDTIVLPGSQSATATTTIPPAPSLNPVSADVPTPASPSSSSTIPPTSIPRVPPPPPGGKIQTAPPTSIPPPTAPSTPPKGPSVSDTPPSPPAPPPPPTKRKPRSFRRFLLTLTLLSGFGYAGGVYYSLISDNFHDFFTEYIPFGEDAVLYFEERDFRRRFPNASNAANRPLSRNEGNRVTIPSKSGLSWKVSEESGKGGSDLQGKGRHMSALEEKKDDVQQNPSSATPKEKLQTVEAAKKEASPASSDPSPIEKRAKAKPENKNVEKPEPKQEQRREDGPKKVETIEKGLPKIAPIETIDILQLPHTEEPIVQDLVKTINDIITVVNADNASSKYSNTLSKAKADICAVTGKILTLKDTEKKVAEEKIRSNHEEFDKAAKELVRRLEDEMRDQEARWKEEFEAEREKISQTYQGRLQTELERSKQVSEQRLRNELLEQAIELKRKFISDVQDRVEHERSGRLSKLTELSANVSELEKLTTNWNSVIDANLQTQHLQVAIEALRSTLEKADSPRPFVRELAALKEVASDDPVINAAIASINPTAYQRGLPTTSQLIDRFRRVASEVRKASLLPEDAGVASHAASLLLSKVLFKKSGLAVGNDVESVLTRAETLLEEGNLDEAARDVNGLQGWAKTLSKDWLADVRRVLEVQQALDVISTEARLQSLRVD